MTEKTLLNATVSLLVKGNKVHLGLKLRKIGAGRLNGPGGGVRKGETIKGAAIRELEEETGKKKCGKYITTFPEYLEKVAIVDFHNATEDGESFVYRVHFFLVRKWHGKAKDTDEMINLQPYMINDLPVEKMMPADREFFPLILNGKKVIATAKYGPFQKELSEPMEIKEVDSLPEE